MTTSTDDAVQDRINRYWTRRADGYHDFQQSRFDTPEIRDTWRQIWAAALPEPPATVLDVGTGTGHVAMLLADLGHDVLGIDLADGMVERARATAASMSNPPRFERGDAVAPPVPETSLDVITSRYVIWTLREPDRALATWRRLLRPGGRMLAIDSTWFPDGLPTTAHGEAAHANPTFAEHYDAEVRAALPLAEATTIEAMADRVRAAGFTDVTVEPLHQLLDLDRRHGVAPNHEARLQYLITGHA